MKTARVPVYYPVDHKANFSGYQHAARLPDDEIVPWPLSVRIGVLVALSLAGWAVFLAPFLLIG